MSSSRPASRPRRPRTPLWVVEGLDIARLRAVPLRAVVVALCLVGVVLAILVPDLVPPTALVGAAVALAALLLGLAVAVAVDAADLTVRGPRHVRAAGGELVAILPSGPDPEGAVPLAEAVLEAREEDGQRLLLGLAAAGRDARRCSAWTDALAVALARTGASVLRVDLANGRSERAGLVEVVREGRKLPSVVTFDPDLRLARIGAGHDHAGALEALPTLPTRLPRDLDVLLVALPTAASRQVVAATAALDHVLVVAERDSTSRVDLIAGLDALEAAGIAAQVMLLDDRTAARLAPAAAVEVDAALADAAAPDGPDGPDDVDGPGDADAVDDVTRAHDGDAADDVTRAHERDEADDVTRAHDADAADDVTRAHDADAADDVTRAHDGDAAAPAAPDGPDDVDGPDGPDVAEGPDEADDVTGSLDPPSPLETGIGAPDEAATTDAPVGASALGEVADEVDASVGAEMPAAAGGAVEDRPAGSGSTAAVPSSDDHTAEGDRDERTQGGPEVATQDGPEVATQGEHDGRDPEDDRSDAPVSAGGAGRSSSAPVPDRGGSADPRTGSSDRRATDPGTDTGVRLLPGAETAPHRPSPDLQQPSVAPRDLDVVLGAAAASAAAHADARDEPLPPIARRPDGTSAAERATDRPSPSSAPAETQRMSPVRGGASPTPEPVDDTEEIPSVDPGASHPSRLDPDEPERDDLRTTAQLAILLDDLQARRDRS
jgi:hypothetical protein